MTIALMILSPLYAEQFTPQHACDLATTLKQRGITRIDIACDPRQNEIRGECAKGYPAPDFDQLARVLRDLIFIPVIGQCDVIDVTNLFTRPKKGLAPDIRSLSNVGALFSSQAHGGELKPDHSMNTTDGRDIAMLMYMALHERMAMNNAPDIVVWPRLSGGAKNGIRQFGSAALQQEDQWGDVIDLSTLQNAIMFANSASRAHNGATTLHA